MSTNSNLTATVHVYTRHHPTRKRPCTSSNPDYRGCQCLKWLYVFDGTTKRRFSAKTRSWKQAESVANVERDRLDPYKRKVREWEEEQAQKAAAEQAAQDAQKALLDAQQADRITIEKALDRWLSSEKDLSSGSLKAYVGSARRLQRWAERQGLVYLDQVDANLLDQWRGTWGRHGNKHDKIGPSTQSSFLVRLKSFFKWAYGIKLIQENPAANLKRIRPDYAATKVLSPVQFNQLLAAIEPFCAAQSGEVREFANEFRALFLLQRVTGLRIIDCLLLPRTAIIGDRLHIVTQKTKAEVRRKLPAVVVEALTALSANRLGFKPDYFLWGSNLQQSTLSTRWGRIIARINPFLRFKDEQGQPMHFHSHVLRDTFAVELLLSGMKLEDVSKLLTHESIKTTEAHYAPWVSRREKQLEDKLGEALSGMGFNA